MKQSSLRILITTLVICTYLCACQHPHQVEMVSYGPGQRNDLAFYFKKSATNEQIDSFLRNELDIPEKDGTGYSVRKGIEMRFATKNNGYVGYVIKFHSSATEEQRKAVKAIVRNSPLIYRIYENVVPNEINDLK